MVRCVDPCRVRGARRGVRAQWPVASGRILAARGEVKLVENDNDRRHRDDAFYRATVRYAYQVGGRDYRSTRLCVGRPDAERCGGREPRFRVRRTARAIVSLLVRPEAQL